MTTSTGAPLSTNKPEGTDTASTAIKTTIAAAIQAINDYLAGETKAVLTAAGDLIYASAANTLARLAKGTARQQLAMNSGATAPEWVASLQSLLTAQGDILQASAANTPARLALGNPLEHLRVNAGGTALEYAAGEVYVAAVTENVVNDVDPGGTAWTDLDLTAQTSATATRVLLGLRLMNETRAARLMLRPNGSGATGVSVDAIYSPAAGAYGFGQAICGLDAGQVLEYGTQDIAGDVEHVWISVIGYWQPA